MSCLACVMGMVARDEEAMESEEVVVVVVLHAHDRKRVFKPTVGLLRVERGNGMHSAR